MGQIQRSNFIQDVQSGLESWPKKLPSKYFYDEKGDALFQKIMHCQDYYPTRCEFEILSNQHQAILHDLNLRHATLDVVELGAGDGYKTKELLKGFLSSGISVKYRPVDISAHAIELITATMKLTLPGLPVDGITGDYFDVLSSLNSTQNNPMLVLFLGSNIGNMTQENSIDFLSSIAKLLGSGDHLLVGFDLVKHPEIVRRAYNDSDGYTKAFNLNLLRRINKELDANFDVEKFLHWPVYDPEKAEARSYLINTEYQEVSIPATGKKFCFNAWEAIHTEVSRKYSQESIEIIANKANFKICANYTDKHDYFSDVLMKPA